ncbi:NAD(P)-binding protein, partial [Mytilinidion resinicola]
MDVTDDAQIAGAAARVGEKFGKLDLLVNNAATAGVPKPDNSDIRQVYDNVLSVNVTSVAAVTYAFLPLLKKSEDPRVINISSARGSITRLTAKVMPKTISIPYCVSKAALHMLTMEIAEAEPEILFQAVSPGHCKTAFNGFRGPKDPLDGAEVAVELALSERGSYKSALWENEGNGMIEVPW